MRLDKNHFLILLIALSLLSCTDIGSDKSAPKITAQGFIMSDVQQGQIGQFGDLRLRIECAGRIRKLSIKERSYEVDLATTPERSHFPLFGIEKRTRLHTDVTLNFRSYINEKLRQAGQYVFNIEVADQKGQSSKATLNIVVVNPKEAAGQLEVASFQMQRQGKSAVSGSEPFGISWTTIDKIRVAIRITRNAKGADKLTRFTPGDYNRFSTKEELSVQINNAKNLDSIVFDTSNNAALGQVMGISNLGKYYLLRVLKSHTSLSDIGTTVTLNGEYKF